MAIKISACDDEHVPGLEALWQQCLTDDPHRDIAGAAVSAGTSPRSTLILVASDGTGVIGSVMAGYSYTGKATVFYGRVNGGWPTSCCIDINTFCTGTGC